jgi:pimeloyl-ACP methyl ester carboxylesterase
MAGSYVTTDAGVRLYYEMVGTGSEVVVFPSGLLLEADFTYLAGGRTLVFYDARNRGLSDVADPGLPALGIHDDVADLEALRRELGFERMALFGHSYMGVTAAVYAMTHPSRISRVVQMSPAEPRQGKEYPPHLRNVDDLLRETFARLGDLQRQFAMLAPDEFCRRFWSILTPIYVVNPDHASRIKWSRCDQPNEVGFLKHWLGSILPSLQALELPAEMVAAADMPVLVVHGRQDRSAPYGGAREWAMLLPDARLLTVDPAAHAPWLEQPAQVLEPLQEFLSGRWPAAAERVTNL